MNDAASRVARAALPHLDAAYNLARWLVRDPHAAEDVVQEAFARAMTYAAGFREENPRAWLLAIVRGVAYDRLARERRFVPLDEEAHAELPDPDPGPEDAAMRGERAGQLGALLELLPPEWRECVVLREIEDMSYRDIARIAGVPVGTVMSRLFRARQALAKHAREVVR
jgi:RNA polymerase sigma-70 factor (ECF subfamily)